MFPKLTAKITDANVSYDSGQQGQAQSKKIEKDWKSFYQFCTQDLGISENEKKCLKEIYNELYTNLPFKFDEIENNTIVSNWENNVMLEAWYATTKLFGKLHVHLSDKIKIQLNRQEGEKWFFRLLIGESVLPKTTSLTKSPNKATLDAIVKHFLDSVEEPKKITPEETFTLRKGILDGNTSRLEFQDEVWGEFDKDIGVRLPQHAAAVDPVKAPAAHLALNTLGYVAPMGNAILGRMKTPPANVVGEQYQAHNNSVPDSMTSVVNVLKNLPTWLADRLAAFNAATQFPSTEGIPIKPISAGEIWENAAQSDTEKVKRNPQAALSVTHTSSADSLLFGHYTNITPAQLLSVTVELYNTRGKREELARTIQQWRGHYGGEPNEVLSKPERARVIHQFVEHNAFGGSLGQFTQQSLLKLLKEKPEIGDIRLQTLRAMTNPFAMEALNGASDKSKDFLLTQVVHEKLPILRYSDVATLQHTEGLKLTDFKWIMINAGLCYTDKITDLAETETLTKPPSLHEAQELGEHLYEQLKAGSVSTAWVSCFALSSLVRDTVRHRSEIPAGKKQNINQGYDRALSEFFADYESHLIKNNPVLHYQDLLNNYKTRPQLAESLIKECPNGWAISMTDYLEKPDSTKCPTSLPDTSFVAQSNHPAAQSAMTMRKQADGPLLEDINKKFLHQNKKIADAYEVIDKIFVTSAWNALPNDELDFLGSANIRWAEVRFSSSDDFTKIPGNKNAHQARREAETIKAKGAEFFIAQHGHEERVYSMVKNDVTEGAGYGISRTNRERTRYVDMTISAGAPRWPEERHELKINGVGALLHGSHEKKLEGLVNAVVTQHKEELLKQLYDAGYKKTDQEKFLDVIKSLIPLYTCINAIEAGNTGEAVFSCSVDAVSLLLPIGKLTALSTRFGEVLTVNGLKAVHKAAARHSLKIALTEGGKKLAQYAVYPALQTVSKKEAVAVPIAMVRVFDPGFELVYHVGKRGIKQSLQLFEQMTTTGSKLKPTPTLESLKGLLSRIPNDRGVIGECAVGRFPSVSQEIPVVRVGADPSNGKALYVRFNPESGEGYGRKYTLSENGMLVPAPLDKTLAERVNSLLTEGLGGNCSVLRQCSIVAEHPRQIDDRILSEINKYLQEHPQDVDLEQLTTKFKVKDDDLIRLDQEGKLTSHITQKREPVLENAAYRELSPDEVRLRQDLQFLLKTKMIDKYDTYIAIHTQIAQMLQDPWRMSYMSMAIQTPR